MQLWDEFEIMFRANVCRYWWDKMTSNRRILFEVTKQARTWLKIIRQIPSRHCCCVWKRKARVRKGERAGRGIERVLCSIFLLSGPKSTCDGGKEKSYNSDVGNESARVPRHLVCWHVSQIRAYRCVNTIDTKSSYLQRNRIESSDSALGTEEALR